MNAVDTQIQAIQRTAILVRAAQAGDREAFGELFQRYEQAVFATALQRVRNRQEAEDVVQEVFIKAMDKIGQLRAPESFGGWLQAIAHRTAINRLVRSKPVHAAEPAAMAAIAAPDASPLDEAVQVERRQQVRDGIRRLRAMDRDTLEAFYLQNQSVLQMSDTFDVPVGTIKRRLHVARKRLAEEIARA